LAAHDEQRTHVVLPWPEVCSAAVSPDGLLVATGHKEGLLQMWELTTLFPMAGG
jgi:hypothetical protein